MTKRATQSRRAAIVDDADEEDIKPDIQELSTFQAFSRTHRAELHNLVGQTALKPSVSFCSNWASARNIDPAAVDDWVQRRTGGGKKENFAGGRGKARGGATAKTSAAIRESVVADVRVKRERAESPILRVGSPPTKKVKTGRNPRATASQTVVKTSTTTSSRQPVRHTRAHDVHPHPACPTCAQKVPTPTASPGHTAPSIGDAPSRRTPALKSALRDSALPLSSARRPRQVRFSGLPDGVNSAYTHAQAPNRPENGAYNHSSSYVCSADSSPVLPPRFKRKMIASGNYPAKVVPSRAAIEPYAVSFEDSPTDPDSWPAIPTSALRTGASDDTADPDTSPELVLPPKRRKLSHGFGPAAESASSPLTTYLPSAQEPSTEPSALPRTPSPRVQVKIENSLFSPTFFSGSSRPSSPVLHSEDEHMLPSSSPPTSPPPMSSPKVVSPVPLRPLAKQPLLTIQETLPVNPRAPSSSQSAALLRSSTHSIPSIPQCPSPRHDPSNLPPPQDIPRPSRTSPCPDGHPPRSRPTTPQPKPHRPEDDPEACAKARNADDVIQPPGRFPSPADLPPRARTPPFPDGPESGSRPGTPQPRPVRPEIASEGVEGASARSLVAVKREQIEAATSQLAGTTFVLEDDEDDEPLMVVLARKRKAQSQAEVANVANTANVANIAKMQTEKPKKRSKRGVKAKTATVKAECVEEQVQQVPPVPPKKRGRRKNATKATAAAVKVEPAPMEAVVADAVQDSPVQGSSKAKTPESNLKDAEATEDAAVDVVVPVISWGAKDSIDGEQAHAPEDTAKPKTKKKKSKKTKENAAKGAKTGPARSESQDTKTWRPPHTLVHPPAHLELVGGGVSVSVRVGEERGGEPVRWDEKGFGCMELSALPWIAGVGYRAVEVRFGEKDVLFEPTVPRVVEEPKVVDELPDLLVPDVVEEADGLGHDEAKA
ncbi:hypothetical protein L226DRAFT_617269 [Lentinus tigrinus ALCF2SS1-7]|uniref:Uncharacterized protein n=1 Tax=Lentinus tigrinus ALCF2SS1-6 TaxID=1328759 RepID=A0A5C2RUI8_9APHY|nr:hypothetical protein L227DRAFT_657977 [Lentinus tigrinus ALCF2SS1-6]RPD68806.1 hypothetical protein L226DRAFT_617269 [Lentinus tigrinus ALCF2SS1-7]